MSKVPSGLKEYFVPGYKSLQNDGILVGVMSEESSIQFPFSIFFVGLVLINLSMSSCSNSFQRLQRKTLLSVVTRIILLESNEKTEYLSSPLSNTLLSSITRELSIN